MVEVEEGKELLSLLNNEPFRSVYQNGLVETKDFRGLCLGASNCSTVRLAWG